jgi:hypothetical protein
MARSWLASSIICCGAAVLLASGCGGGGDGSEVDDGGTGASNGTGANNGSAGTFNIDVSGSSSGGGTPIGPDGKPIGDGTPELCNGKDDDRNGIIDDVDAGHDGVCDCLNIATVGHIGPWSNGGNIFKTWLDARSPIGAVELADDELTADELAKYQIVVVLHVATTEVDNEGVVATAHHAFSEAETGVFDAWVRGGGGVMTTIGYSGNEADEIVNVNTLLAPLGMGYSTDKLDLSGNVEEWVTHPVSDGISNIFTDNGVEPDGPDGMTIALGGDKVALQVAQIDTGRVAVWGDEWITYDSEWADVDGQQVEHFWLNLLKWLSPPGQCQVPIPPRVK